MNLWKTIMSAIERKSSHDDEDDSKEIANKENLQVKVDGVCQGLTGMKRSDLNVMIVPKKSSNMESIANMDDSNMDSDANMDD